MSYRGYDLEQKTLMVGWQITITKDGKFVHNGSVTKNLTAAVDEAEKYVDHAIAQADIAASAEVRARLETFNGPVRAETSTMLKGIEKMERSARYVVRLQKDGQYTVVMSRPEWANREIPGFATEAEAKAWIAGRRQQSRL